MNNMNNNSDNQITMFEMVMGFLTVFNTMLNTKQTSNDTIFKELQHQNTDYLENILQSVTENKKDMLYGIDAIIRQNEKILKQNEKIEEKLNKLENDIENMKSLSL